MNLDFLDNGLPIVPGQGGLAGEEIINFRKYCKSLGKTPSQLTMEELEKYYSLNDDNSEV
jgi:hypothetical protein